MRNPLTLPLIAAILACCPVSADSLGGAVTLELRTDGQGPLRLYPAPGASGNHRAYAEAVKGARYRLIVHNNLSCRVGLVIAVDGRNIISGGVSDLAPRERMYILTAGQTCEFTGWRTGQDRENRFYFTTADDSYAGAFSDLSAMGVVAMAVFQEHVPQPAPRPSLTGGDLSRNAPCAGAPAPMAENARKAEAQSRPGTGYGEEVYSPSVTVQFRPESRPLEKAFIKYEWRETLCRLGLIQATPAPRNRLWDSGFAPPPPARHTQGSR